SRDEFVIDFDKNTLKHRIAQLENKTQTDEVIAQAYDLKDKSNWKLSNVRKQIQELDDSENFIKPIQYRPFDNRYIFYHESLVERTRYDVMQHILESNISLCFMRQFSGDMDYSHFLVSNYIVDNSTFFGAKGTIQQAPLYLYNKKESKKSHFHTLMLFEP
ncbi:MAG TPA: DNA methyltransferase, partial [Smithella sp.]|nr:DNA methyltransferase [Smithella sp.]